MQARNENQARADDRTIVVTRDVPAPRETVWAAMTDPEQVKRWWGPRGFTTSIERMEVRPGGAWKHVMHGPDGTDYPNLCTFREVTKPGRIVYTHAGGRKGEPGVQSEVTWTFEELGGGLTRVTIRMEFPTAADRDRVAKEFGAVEGGKQTLERLSEQLRAPGTNLEFVVERVFDAPRDLVFKAWTEAGRLDQWLGPKGCTIRSARLELEPGGVFHFSMRMPDGPEMWGKWVFREIDPPKRLVFVSSFSDAAGGLTRHPLVPNWPLESLSTVTFAEEGGKTRLTLRWAPRNPTETERAAFDGGRESMEKGWSGTFGQLDAHLAHSRAEASA